MSFYGLTLVDFNQIASVGDIWATGNVPLDLQVESVFTDLYHAINTVPENTLILVAPGVYHSTCTFFECECLCRNLAVRGVGDSPEDVVLTRSHVNYMTFGVGKTVTIENLTIRSLTGTDNMQSYARRATNVTYSKVFFDARGSSGGYFMERPDDDTNEAVIRLRYVTLAGTHQKSFFNLRQGTQLKRSEWSLHRIVYPRSSYGDGATPIGTFAEDDRVTTPQEGYGHHYGDFYISLVSSTVSGVVLDPQVKRPVRVVVFDWNNPWKHVRTRSNDQGEWVVSVPPQVTFGVYYLSQNHRITPVIHGPYTAPNN